MKATNNVTPCAKAPARRTIKTRGAISCIAVERTARGRSVGVEHFDVPAEHYETGNMTGCRLALEFMAALKTDTLEVCGLGVIMAACKAFGEGTSYDVLKSRRGAAEGFVGTLALLLRWISRAGIHERFIEKIIERAPELMREEAQIKKDKKANFARRMEVAQASAAQARREINRIAKASSGR